MFLVKASGIVKDVCVGGGRCTDGRRGDKKTREKGDKKVTGKMTKALRRACAWIRTRWRKEEREKSLHRASYRLFLFFVFRGIGRFNGRTVARKKNRARTREKKKVL